MLIRTNFAFVLLISAAIFSTANLSARGGGGERGGGEHFDAARGGDADRYRADQFNRTRSMEMNRALPRDQAALPRNDIDSYEARDQGNSYDVNSNNTRYNVNSPRAIDDGRQPIENAAIRNDVNRDLNNYDANWGGYDNGFAPEVVYPPYQGDATQNLEVDTDDASDTNSNQQTNNPQFSLERPGYDPQ